MEKKWVMSEEERILQDKVRSDQDDTMGDTIF